MEDPFDLDDSRAYAAWRTRKLASYPAGIEQLAVEIRRLGEPSQPELAAIKTRVADFNMALIRANPEAIRPEAVLSLGRALGLERADTNLFADSHAVSRITTDDPPECAPGETAARRRDYIPYTSKPLSWHTDGYYNAPAEQILAWTLFCVRPARQGGINALMDPEIAYIRLRDASVRHIEALSHPEALRIPANIQDGRLVRAESLGPVFSVRSGHLHMRYSARSRNAVWRATAETQAAREALSELFSSGDAFTFEHKLEAGEGILSNNVLHNRSGFEDEQAMGSRLLLRVRYRDRMTSFAHRAGAH